MLKTELTAEELTEELNRWATMYGRRRVTVTAVKGWYARRDQNGFPEKSGNRDSPHQYGRDPKEWNAAQAIIWYLGYEPNR